MDEKVLGKDVRKVLKVGGSLAITLPSDYVQAHKIEAGDAMTVFYDDVFHAEPVTDAEILDKVGRREVNRCQ